MRLAREALEGEQNKRQPRQSARFRGLARSFAAAPLVAGLITAIGCSDAELPNDCKSYNETTITLNQETNGQSVDLRGLENLPSGSFLTPYHVDFINEAHAIASEGLPLDTKATQSPSYCLMSGPNGGQRSAYAQQSDADGAQRGLYVPENQSLDSVTLINLTNHEIGHLQPGNPERGSEVLSQLNEFEQKLAGFVVLQNQGADEGQLARWSYHEAHSGLYQKLARTIESGRGQEGGEPLDAYDKANMFLFIRLGETGGDIPAVRSEFRERVTDGSLEGELISASEIFLGRYATENLPDLFIDVRMRLIMAMERQYGQGAAYSEAHSRLLATGPAIGLEGMNCALTVPLAPDDYSACSGNICEEVGADISRPVTLSLCCMSAEVTAGVVEFSKWSVEASGTRYEKDGGTVSSGGFSYGSVTYLSAVKTAMGPDDPCI